ncbi:MAG: N-acetylmuramoyl-L-alanine amidase [Rhodospirillales bacterium]|nr:N-acetylmuramoyl-L-alanine amidase [Rhodospirillales bacterium]MDP6883592.1 N-acetylmuramoyl-L-alanine amidase [Rhodospirillales bacterium]
MTVSILVLSTALGGVPRPASAEAIVVTDVRVGQHGDVTRFVLDFTHKVEFTLFTLAEPDRLIIDLPEVGWRLPPRPLPRRTGVLKTLRYGLFKPGLSRVVVDLTRPVAARRAYLMDPEGGRGYRLILDLVPATRAAFLAVGKVAPAPGTAGVQASPTGTPRRDVVATARRPLFPTPPRKPEMGGVKRVIAIDPGHGGVDPGTVGRSGIYEKDITLSMAREIRDRLQATGRYKVVLTRDRDVFVRLRDRIAVSREAGAELFISIHADAIKNSKIRGLSVYTLSEKASDKEAAALAEKENKADLIAGIDLTKETPEVTNILIDLAQRESMNQSARFAARLVKELARETKLLRNTHRFAGFVVLKAPDVPSVLMELGFLSNRQDEAALKRKSYRAKLIAAMARAADTYFSRIEEAVRP